MNFNVVINTDDNYIQHCMAMLCSLYENNKNHTIFLHVLSNKLSDINKEFITSLTLRYNNSIKFYYVNDDKIGNVQFRKQRPLSKAAYYRLLLSTLLDVSIQKVLYLDCDMIVLQDVSPLFDIELDNYALAASRDSFPYTDQHRRQLHMEVGEKVFCSGIMLINLKYWREGNFEERLIEYAQRNRKEVHLHDQDVLNYVFKKQWYILPPKWNRNAYSEHAECFEGLMDFDYKEYQYNPVVLHYASVEMKPWINVNFPNRKPYLKYLFLSGFPNPKFQPGNLRMHCKATILNLMIWVNRYISPYMPNLVRLLLVDIKKILLIPFQLFK